MCELNFLSKLEKTVLAAPDYYELCNYAFSAMLKVSLPNKRADFDLNERPELL